MDYWINGSLKYRKVPDLIKPFIQQSNRPQSRTSSIISNPYNFHTPSTDLTFNIA